MIKRNYPEWFINELVNEEDKKRALSGELSSTSICLFKCKCGNIYRRKVNYQITIKTMERKQNCPVCSKFIKRSYPDWFIDELVEEKDVEEAKNGSLKWNKRVKFRCANGHIYEQIVDNHIKISTGERKYGCSICAHKLVSTKYNQYMVKKRSYPDWFIDELVDEEDKKRALSCELKSTDRIRFICENNHIYESTVNNKIDLKKGYEKHGCPYCKSNRSKPELEIEEYVKELGYNTEHKRFRDSNHKLFEVDIFIPERNVGIEYNGSVYHSSKNGVYKNLNKLYHYTKFYECGKKDILLITIFDIEWDNRKEEIRQYIKDILEGKETSLSYNKEGYMNNNYPCWKHYKSDGKYSEEIINVDRFTIYTCGYTKM